MSAHRNHIHCKPPLKSLETSSPWSIHKWLPRLGWLIMLVPVLVTAQPLQNVISVRGQLRPAEFATLSAGVSRSITAVSRKTGEDFKIGDVLVRFDCREEEAEKEIISARLLGAKTRFDVNNRLDVLENVSKLELELSRSDMAMAQGEL